MALTYTGTGGLFTRIGAILGEFNRVVSGYGSALDAGIENIWDEFPNSDGDAISIDGLLTARDVYRGVHSAYTNSLVQAAVNTVINQVDRQGSPLTTKGLNAALTELKAQMVADGESLNRPTTSASVSAGGSNLGNAVVNVSLTNPFGDPLDMVFDESLKMTVTTDVSNGGTRFAEVLTVTGQPSSSATDYRWPRGSGASRSLAITDASTTGLLTDGGFETWVSTTPTHWSVTTGAATVDKSASNTVRGSHSIKFTSDGSTLTTIRQQLSPNLVKSNRVYALNLWAMVSSADTDGVVRFRLTDSGGTTLTDDAGTDNSYTRNMNGQIGTSLTQVSTFFRTKRQLPGTGGVWLEISVTTSPANGIVLYMDHLGLVEATEMYPGGPWCAAFSKDAANALRDTYTLTVTNDGTHNSFVRALDRIFDLRRSGIYLPTASSETISDSLIG